MNAMIGLSFEEMMEIRLEVLKFEHRNIDAEITTLEQQHHADQLALRRLKKQKLNLKDQIVRLRGQLLPDIIA